MNITDGKNIVFYQSYAWLTLFLFAFGGVFLSLAIVLQFYPARPENINLMVNGVRQPATMETLRLMRLIFLIAFGVPGFTTIIIGAVICFREKTNENSPKI